jgi:hypothetical protein
MKKSVARLTDDDILNVAYLASLEGRAAQGSKAGAESPALLWGTDMCRRAAFSNPRLRTGDRRR